MTKDEACEMEKILIRELDSNDVKHGYNKSSGGEYGRAGIKLSDEVKEKIRISNTGKFVSEETKQKFLKIIYIVFMVITTRQKKHINLI